MSSDDNTAANFAAMRQRASLLEGAGARAPPPAFMWKPGSQDEAGGMFKRALKRLVSTWKRRRVMVNPAIFQYEDTESNKVVGVIKTADISKVNVVNRAVMKEHGSPDNLQDFGWVLTAGGRQYVFACESAGVRDNWVGYLGSIVKQRQEEDETALLDDDDAQSHAVTAASRVRSSFDPDFARENLASVAGDVVQANDDVFNEVARLKSKKFRKHGASDDEHDDDDNQRHHEDDRDDLGDEDDGALRGAGAGLKEYMKGYKRAIDEDGNELDDGEINDRSSESEILVTRGDELVAATVAEMKAPRVDLLQVPGPNKNYRRENIVIEALFEDLRTQEPDHVRLAGFETPVSALSYFQPQLLRAAQDNDLPGDLPPKPLFVSEYLARADSRRPSMRHCAIPANKMPGLLQALKRVEAGPALFRIGSGSAGTNYVVDSEGIIVACPSSIPLAERPITALTRAMLARHRAEAVFNICRETLFVPGWRRSSSIMIPHTPSPVPAAAAAMSGAGGNRQYLVPSNAPGSQQSRFAEFAGAGGNGDGVASAGVSGLLNNGPLSAAATAGSFAGHKSVSFGGDALKDGSTTPSPVKPSASVAFVDNSSENGDGYGGGTNLAASGSGGIMGFLNKSIHALRGGGSSSMAAVHQNYNAQGDGMDTRRDTASNLSFQSERTLREGASPSVYGPVITIETTHRRIVVTDMSYRSDIMQAEKVTPPPPLYLITYIEMMKQ